MLKESNLRSCFLPFLGLPSCVSITHLFYFFFSYHTVYIIHCILYRLLLTDPCLPIFHPPCTPSYSLYKIFEKPKKSLHPLISFIFNLCLPPHPPPNLDCPLIKSPNHFFCGWTGANLHQNWSLRDLCRMLTSLHKKTKNIISRKLSTFSHSICTLSHKTRTMQQIGQIQWFGWISSLIIRFLKSCWRFCIFRNSPTSQAPHTNHVCSQREFVFVHHFSYICSKYLYSCGLGGYH